MANQSVNEEDRHASVPEGIYHVAASCGQDIDNNDFEDSFDYGDGLPLAFEQDTKTHLPAQPPIHHGVFWPGLGQDGATNTYPQQTISHESSAHHAWGDHTVTHWPQKVDHGDHDGKGLLNRGLKEFPGTSKDRHDELLDHHSVGKIMDARTSHEPMHHNGLTTGSNLFQDGRNHVGLAYGAQATYNDDRLVTCSSQSLMGRDLADYREMDRVRQSYFGGPHFTTSHRPNWNSYEPGDAACGKALESGPDAEMKDSKGTSSRRRRRRSSNEVASPGLNEAPLPHAGRVQEECDLLEPLPFHPEDADNAAVSLEPLELQVHPHGDLDHKDLSTQKQPPAKRHRQSRPMKTDAGGEAMHSPRPPPTATIPKKPQLQRIDEDDICDNDVLLGRGGKTNHHPGNAAYLRLIQEREVEYMLLGSRNEKTVYAMGLVQQLREKGIRFLKRDEKDKKFWNDVGDDKMREKVSQNLRERQPQLRKRIECPSDKSDAERRRSRKKRGSFVEAESGKCNQFEHVPTIPRSSSQVAEQQQVLKKTDERHPKNWESV